MKDSTRKKPNDSTPPILVESLPGGVNNSPPLEGWTKVGVANSLQGEVPILTIINETPIFRNFVDNLPANPTLRLLARNKRKAGILGEVLFWQQVHRGKFHHIDFDRQRVIGSFIVDFYVKALGLVIEIDGSSHDGKEAYDARRQAYLEGLGLRVYRIADGDVRKNMGRVLEDLERYLVGEYAAR